MTADLQRSELSTLAAGLPPAWIGYGFAVLQLISTFVVRNPWDSDNTRLLWTFSVGYFLFYVYKLHEVLGAVPGWRHPIAPNQAVIGQIFPFFNLYWVFHWVSDIANFVNERSGKRLLSTGFVGSWLFLGVLLDQVPGGVGSIIMFSACAYISARIRQVLSSSVTGAAPEAP